MIIDEIVIIESLKKRQVKTFLNYTEYQEWLIEEANPINKLCLAWKFSIEREKESKLEREYGLPLFILRGALFRNKEATIKSILEKGVTQNYTLSKIIRTIRNISNPYPRIEPSPIQLPIRTVIDYGDEVGSIYSFGDYESYFNWKLNKTKLFKRSKLIKLDRRQREQELIIEIKFGKKPGYFRGIFAIDYVNVLPAQASPRYSTDDLMSERTHSFKPIGFNVKQKRPLFISQATLV